MTRKLNLLLLMMTLVVFTSAAAWADAIDFGFSGGVLNTNTSGGLTTTPTGSSLDKVYENPSGPTTTTTGLGTVYLTTGSASGSLFQNSTTLSSTGSSISIVSNAFTMYDSTGTTPVGNIAAGTNLFTGSFIGNITWSYSSLSDMYTLTGAVSGSVSPDLASIMGLCSDCYYKGQIVTLNLKAASGGGYNVASGNMAVSPVPEPASLTLLGAGLFALGSLGKKKFLR